ncbi:LAMI_0C03796g1_1 [Lachancea mirantina]|uniref:Pre-rRNA-processing protein RIX1 n=1 Tax=Lachancea mirantina TaxID=1230905 RepID=A0A1G4J1R4_9SACH|nr:LAMI_0C03796g1_1 [Lachancea mirantina]
MGADSIPVSKIANLLESTSGYEFQAVLQSLTDAQYVNQQLLKSELFILVNRVLKLLRSGDDYLLWKGCNVILVLCAYNPVILCAHADVFLKELYLKLEKKVEYYSSSVSSEQGRIVLTNLVHTVGYLIDLIRGKPAVTREVLTPKLSAIIPTFIKLSQYEPRLCLPFLKKLLYKNTNTFRPFVNKLYNVLVILLTKDYQSFDVATKRLICDTFAYTHLIKLNPQTKNSSSGHHSVRKDEQYRHGLLLVLSQIRPLITLCGELFDFSADFEMERLVASLPDYQGENFNSVGFFEALDVDMNKPFTLWRISERLDVLNNLIISFCSLATPFAIRVPIGGISKVIQALLNLSVDYLPLKRGLRRDAELLSVIENLSSKMQHEGVKLFQNLAPIYGRCLIPFYPELLGSLELIVPTRKGSTNVDFQRVKKIRPALKDVFELLSHILPAMGRFFDDGSLAPKLVDVALHFTKSMNLTLSLLSGIDQSDKKGGSNKKDKKSNKRLTGSMSDVFSHPEAFTIENSFEFYAFINEFLTTMIRHKSIPSNHHVKITRYAIQNATVLNEQLNYVPASFRDLLRALVLCPGSERCSILPMAVSLLKKTGDELYGVICNPRLPLGVVHSIAPAQLPEYAEDQSLEDNNASSTNESLSLEETTEVPATEQNGGPDATPATSHSQCEIIETHVETQEESIENELSKHRDKIFKRRSSDADIKTEEVSVKVAKVARDYDVLEEIVSEQIDNGAEDTIAERAVFVEQQTERREADGDSDSDFEIPEIVLEEDDGEDEE